MIAIKKSLFFDVGGFEPDTIGVETNRKDGLFQKPWELREEQTLHLQTLFTYAQK